VHASVHGGATTANGDISVASSHAEEFYLQGRYYWNKRTPEDLTRAIDYFTQAIVSDPNYAKAYVGLADSYNLLREFSAMPANEAYPRALAAASKAVELDEKEWRMVARKPQTEDVASRVLRMVKIANAKA
jgi:tetratricopeptide (TPR) repeat protein